MKERYCGVIEQLFEGMITKRVKQQRHGITTGLFGGTNTGWCVGLSRVGDGSTL